MNHAVNDEALKILFREAHTFRKWRNDPVRPQLLMAIYDVMRWAPTVNNTNPGRILFIVSKEAKERLKPHLSEGNVVQTMTAPATAILAYDTAFYEKLHILDPQRADAAARYKQMEKDALEKMSFRSGTLQAAYFILAARALGLDCGPMSGFKNEGVDKEFFAGTSIKSNFLCNLGYGDPDGGTRPRAPRLAFDDACKIL